MDLYAGGPITTAHGLMYQLYSPYSEWYIQHEVDSSISCSGMGLVSFPATRSLLLLLTVHTLPPTHYHQHYHQHTTTANAMMMCIRIEVMPALWMHVDLALTYQVHESTGLYTSWDVERTLTITVQLLNTSYRYGQHSWSWLPLVYRYGSCSVGVVVIIHTHGALDPHDSALQSIPASSEGRDNAMRRTHCGTMHRVGYSIRLDTIHCVAGNTTLASAMMW